MKTALRKCAGRHSNPGSVKYHVKLLMLFDTSFWKTLRYYVEMGHQYLFKYSLFYKKTAFDVIIAVCQSAYLSANIV
jgi:hypothetical protein